MRFFNSLTVNIRGTAFFFLCAQWLCISLTSFFLYNGYIVYMMSRRRYFKIFCNEFLSFFFFFSMISAVALTTHSHSKAVKLVIQQVGRVNLMNKVGFLLFVVVISLFSAFFYCGVHRYYRIAGNNSVVDSFSVLADIIFRFSMVFLLVSISLFHSIRVSGVRHRGTVLQKCVAAFFFVLYIFILAYIAGHVMGRPTLALLRHGLLDVPVDPCTGAQMKIQEYFSPSYVLTSVVPPSVLTHLIENKQCHSKAWHKLGYVDVQENTLLVTPTCPSGRTPRVHVYRKWLHFESSDDEYASVVDEKVLNFTRDHNLQDTVTIHRLPDNTIQEIELKLELLVQETRAPRSDDERAVRKHWKDPTIVIKVPLGSWIQYIVDCGDLQQLFIHPLSKRDQWEKADVACNEEESPNGNLLVFMMDALSRPAAARRLVKLKRWLDRFRNENKTGYLVEEHALTSLGWNTYDNLPLLAAGYTRTALSEFDTNEKTNITENDLIHSKVKKKYGDSVYTTLSTPLCDSYVSKLGPNMSNSAGLGQRFAGIDQLVFEAYCSTKDDLGMIGPRCFLNQKVHETYFDYISRLMHSTLQRTTVGDPSCPNSGSSFLHFFVMYESHEPTERNTEVADGDLVELIEKIKHFGFFNNPRNSIVFVGDHGIHYGFSRRTDAGLFENYNPLLLHIVHPETLNRIDAFKNRTVGNSISNFIQRKKYLSTHLDVYLTLCDIMGVDCRTHVVGQTAAPPASAFDTVIGRDRPMTCSSLFGQTPFPCTLNFCTP